MRSALRCTSVSVMRFRPEQAAVVACVDVEQEVIVVVVSEGPEATPSEPAVDRASVARTPGHLEPPVHGDEMTVGTQRLRRAVDEPVEVGGVKVIPELGEHDQIEVAVGPVVGNRTLLQLDVGRKAARRACARAPAETSIATTESARSASRPVKAPIAHPGSNTRR